MSAALLTREREFGLARRWREKRDEAALHELVNAHGRLVIKLAARFRNYGLPMSDLVQEGNFGLLQAAMRFEPDRQVRFSTYAAWWIRSAIQDFVLRNWSIVRVGTTAGQKSLFFNLRRLRAKHADRVDGPLSGQAKAKIAEELHVRIDDIDHMEARLGGNDRSLNATVGDGEVNEWQDLLRDERPTPEEEVRERRDTATRALWLARALEELTDRETMIIRARHLREDRVTLEELGDRLGISKERVRQIEHKALEKLRSAVARRRDGSAALSAA